VELGFRIPSFAEFQIPKTRIPHLTIKLFLDSGFLKEKCPSFRNPDYLTWGIIWINNYYVMKKSWVCWGVGREAMMGRLGIILL